MENGRILAIGWIVNDKENMVLEPCNRSNYSRQYGWDSKGNLKRTMIVTQTWRLWDMGFLSTIGSHLRDRSIRQASNQLLALGAPCRAADL
jgi:hypothetical protein